MYDCDFLDLCNSWHNSNQTIKRFVSYHWQLRICFCKIKSDGGHQRKYTTTLIWLPKAVTLILYVVSVKLMPDVVNTLEAVTNYEIHRCDLYALFKDPNHYTIVILITFYAYRRDHDNQRASEGKKGFCLESHLSVLPVENNTTGFCGVMTFVEFPRFLWCI